MLEINRCNVCVTSCSIRKNSYINVQEVITKTSAWWPQQETNCIYINKRQGKYKYKRLGYSQGSIACFNVLLAPCTTIDLERRKITETSLPSLFAKIPLHRTKVLSIVVVAVLVLPNSMPNIPLDLKLVLEDKKL